MDSEETLFLDLVSRSIGALPRDEIFDEFQEKLEAVRSEVEFDLFLWSLAHRLRIDTEELLRQLGERWLVERYEAESLGDSDFSDPLKAMGDLLAKGSFLSAAPVPGASVFEVEILSRTSEQMRLRCRGPRRCCSFLEGVARGVAKSCGLSMRYLRQPKSAALVHITLQPVKA